MATLVLTVLGDDRAGLVSAVSAALDAHGASWERSQLARLAGKFAGVVEVAAPDSVVAALVPALEALAASGLTVVVERTDATVEDDSDADPARGPDSDPSSSPRRLVLDLVGADRPGIVASISSLLADQDISVEQFHSQVQDAPMAGGTVFEAHAVLVAPAALSTGHLRATLEALADELLVDVELAEDPTAG